MPSIAVINPRRRKRSTRRRKTTHRRHARARRRRNPIMNLLGHRRRRSTARRHHRRTRARSRRRHNPGLRLGGGLMAGLNTGAGVALGVIGTNLATGALIHYVPGVPAALTSGLGKTALKLGVGAFLLPMALKALKQHGLARNVAIGAWAAVVLDIYNDYAAPAINKAVGFAGYEAGQLTGLEYGALQGSSIYGGGSIYQR